MIKQSLKWCCVTFCCAGSVLTLAGIAQAAPANIVVPAFQAKLNGAGQHLSQLEARFGMLSTRVTTQKVLRAADLQDEQFETLGRAYAEQMKAAFEDATRDAGMAGKSLGKEGNVANLQAFEKLAKAHETRWKTTETRAHTLQAQLTTGVIKLDPAVLDKATPEERGLYERRSSLDLLQRAALALQAVSPSKWNANWCMDQISGLLVSSAEASVIAPCAVACLAHNWGTCVSCVQAGGANAVAYWNGTFIPCYNSLRNKPWWVPSWAWRAYCIGALIVHLG